MYKCSKEDPNNAINEEAENRSVEMSMRTPIKVTVAGDPAARAAISLLLGAEEAYPSSALL